MLQVLLSLGDQQEANFGVIGILGSDVDTCVFYRRRKCCYPKEEEEISTLHLNAGFAFPRWPQQR